MWVVVLELGAAGGRSHTPLEEHSYRSAAAGPGRENTQFTKKNWFSGSVFVWDNLDLIYKYGINKAKKPNCKIYNRFIS